MTFSPFLNLWKVEKPIVLSVMSTRAESAVALKETECSTILVLTLALAPSPLPPLMVRVGLET